MECLKYSEREWRAEGLLSNFNLTNVLFIDMIVTSRQKALVGTASVEFEPDKDNDLWEESWAFVFMIASFFLVDFAMQAFWPPFGGF